MLTPERWAQIEELFHRAAESGPQHRTALLDQVCSHDAELREQVEALLSSDKSARCNVNAAVRSELNAVAFSLAGKTISHYRILEGLGGGGMGLVYRAEDIKLSRRLAIKFLPEELAKDPHALVRFEREARAASELEHPNICPIYEFGEHEGQPFIVMPLLKGQTIDQFIHAAAYAERPLQILRLLDLATQVLRGLEAAHAHGIIHRDIKPGNIFLTSDGHAKILDFGVAKLLRAEIDVDGDHHAHGEADTATVIRRADLLLSRTGMLVGTAAYMSPQQVRGEQVDARTDLFSFGLVLYELATGKRAFGGSTWPALQEAILRQVPDPARGVNPKVPTKLEAVIKKALEKDREARYQSASEMLAEENLQRQMAPKRLPLRWAVGATGVFLVVLVGAIFWFTKHQPSSSQTLPDLKLRQVTINSSENPVTGGAISPDGGYLAYTDARGMHIKLIESGETRSVPQPEALKNENVNWEITAWSPDSKRFLANAHPVNESSQTSSVWIVSVLGGPPRKIRDNAFAWSVSPDGSSIAFGTNLGKLGSRELWLMSPDGERARKLYEVGEKGSIGRAALSQAGERPPARGSGTDAADLFFAAVV
jgi:eukaryotic-like serine/threonine-protein kinase